MTWLTEIIKPGIKHILRHPNDTVRMEQISRMNRAINGLVKWGLELEDNLRKYGGFSRSERLIKITRDNNLSPDTREIIDELGVAARNSPEK